LPDPALIGNAGSFFKNPEVALEKFDKLKVEFPNIVGYPTANGMKVAAGWMIEQCGWKGKRINDAGVHEKQALVLVNYGQAKGSEILQIARNVQSSVKEKFGIELEMEVNII
jgi:UDP-N-acetylmuramate dehydrogenase